MDFENMLIAIVLVITIAIVILTPIENIYAQDISYEIRNKLDKHPKLESALYQLAQSQSPNEFANTHGIHLKDGTVRVIIELKNETDQISSEFNVTTISWDENFVRAFIPINELIDLADEPYVIFIRTPLKSYPAETPFTDSNLTTLFLISIIVVAGIVFIIKWYRR